VDQPVPDDQDAGVVAGRYAERVQVRPPHRTPASYLLDECRGRVRAIQFLQVRGPSGRRSPAAQRRRVGIEDHGAGGHGMAAGVTQHQPVPGFGRQRVVQRQPGHPPAQRPDPDRYPRRSQVDDELGRQVGPVAYEAGATHVQ
jgi:hypothetical protein